MKRTMERNKQWRDFNKDLKRDREVQAWDDCLVETVVAAVWLVFNDIEFRQRTKALYSTASKFSVGIFLGL